MRRLHVVLFRLSLTLLLARFKIFQIRPANPAHFTALESEMSEFPTKFCTPRADQQELLMIRVVQ